MSTRARELVEQVVRGSRPLAVVEALQEDESFFKLVKRIAAGEAEVKVYKRLAMQAYATHQEQVYPRIKRELKRELPGVSFYEFDGVLYIAPPGVSL